MARATSSTLSFNCISATSGETRIVIERSYVKSKRVGNRYLTATKEFALFDAQGRRYRRVSDMVVTCEATGERFTVMGYADRIRKTS